MKPDKSLKRLQKLSLYDLKELIRQARAMDLANISSEAIDARIGKIMDGYQTNRLTVMMNGVFRARCNEGTELYTNTSQLWYPKPEFVKERGRFNETSKPVFYVSNTARGAMFEVRPTTGQLITLLETKTKQPFVKFDTAHIGMEECEAPAMVDAGKTKLLHGNPKFREQLRRERLEHKWLAVDGYLSDMSRHLPPAGHEQEHYRVTNAIARPLFRITQIAALQYPSIATKLSCINLCMLPAFADENFYPARTWLVSIDEQRDQLPGLPVGLYFGIRFIRKSESIDSFGNITWGQEKTFSHDELIHLLR